MVITGRNGDLLWVENKRKQTYISPAWGDTLHASECVVMAGLWTLWGTLLPAVSYTYG